MLVLPLLAGKQVKRATKVVHIVLKFLPVNRSSWSNKTFKSNNQSYSLKRWRRYPSQICSFASSDVCLLMGSWCICALFCTFKNNTAMSNFSEVISSKIRVIIFHVTFELNLKSVTAELSQRTVLFLELIFIVSMDYNIQITYSTKDKLSFVTNLLIGKCYH